jgi:hypothetical protein
MLYYLITKENKSNEWVYKILFSNFILKYIFILNNILFMFLFK